jgi:SAM-dependent methyltransferase
VRTTPEANAPFGAGRLGDLVAGAARALDVGCGGGRLTVMLARSGIAMTGIDTSHLRLADARDRSAAAGLAVRWLYADMEQPLPFASGEFDALVSRLSLQIADDPVAVLANGCAVVRTGSRLATAVWASVERNPWFGEARSAVADALGPDRARFARAFGRLGEVAALRDAHVRAGLEAVDAELLEGELVAASAAEHWEWLTAGIGHFSRVEAALSPTERDGVAGALERRLAPYRAEGGGLRLPRAQVIARGRVA